MCFSVICRRGKMNTPTSREGEKREKNLHTTDHIYASTYDILCIHKQNKNGINYIEYYAL